MTHPQNKPVDTAFAGSIPAIYESHLVPLLFEPYAADLGTRIASRHVRNLLEIAAGTGVVTRRLASVLPHDAAITATDLNQSMLDQAARIGTARPVEWRQADAMELPFEDASFDVVVCQFGAMFFPDKGKAFGEAHRVLRPGGLLIMNVWDRIVDNEFADVVTNALASVFPGSPPQFLVRTPHNYHDRGTIAGHLAAGGFTAAPEFTTVTLVSRAPSPDVPAIAFCQGTPLRLEIEAQGSVQLGEATAAVARAIAARCGTGAVAGRMQALVVSASR